MKPIHKFGKEMKHSKKSDKRVSPNMGSFKYYFYDATRENCMHQILQGVVDGNYTTECKLVLG